jgi:hypothetical protein
MTSDGTCRVHKTALVGKAVPIFYGMPTPDSDIFEIGRRFPHHGLWSIGGCEVFDDSPENTMELVCSDCNDVAKELE